ncbi:molybdopterin converting factor small subunit [Kribbella voronezhensis]|uniref:Molybdopterin converting factor small subunit n=1 Tax=Kribbella voronezhensis TaxID=2512212 RepID=A0A4V3FK66_9ACTN|nr:MoaD/ThiS family protein [Kribbella voronezhensis]TDU88963.1 molybdopterin converting factor small subunit [Kribbella voronezhensis]
MPEVTIRYFAAARAAAGESTATAQAGSLKELVDTVSADRPELARVLGICSFLVDGDRADLDTPLDDGALVDALPPFAGG